MDLDKLRKETDQLSKRINIIIIFGLILFFVSGMKIGLHRQGVTWSTVWYAPYEAQLDVLLCGCFFVGMISVLSIFLYKIVGELFK